VARPIGPPNPKENSVEAASRFLNCDRRGKSSFSTKFAHTRRPGVDVEPSSELSKALFGRNKVIDLHSVVAELDLKPTHLAAELFGVESRLVKNQCFDRGRDIAAVLDWLTLMRPMGL
jgi:hypothetical protein